MSLINLDGISLMAFSSEEVVTAWREEVIEAERQREQKVNITEYTRIAGHENHTNYAHQDIAATQHDDIAATQHNDVAATRHTDVAATQHSNVAATRHSDGHTNYSRTYRRYSQSGYSRNYTRHSDGHTDYSRRVTTYSKRTTYRRYGTRACKQRHVDYTQRTTRAYSRARYSQSGYSRNNTSHSDGHTNYTRSYTEYSRSGYSRGYTRAHTDSGYTRAHSNYGYTRAHTNAGYTRAHTNTGYTRAHTNVAAVDNTEKTPGYDKGTAHENYIPSAPELYNVDGKVISDTLEIHVASYDKNNDGYGSQNQDSKDIYYIIKIRQIATLDGSSVDDDWTTLLDASMTEDFDVPLDSYDDGIYEISTQAYNNLPPIEESSSDRNIFTATIMNGKVNTDLTVMNANEFYDYAYGLETYVNRSGDVKKYIDSVIYANGSASQQKGLLMEIELKDVSTKYYHKVKAGLQKGDTVIAEGYDVLFQTDSNGYAKPGDKTGLVFIPLDDMLDNGSFEDININLDVTLYTDKELTLSVGEETRHMGISEAKDVIYIDTDNTKPTVVMTDPIPRGTNIQNVNIKCNDTGLGIKEAYCQIVPLGTNYTDDGWERLAGSESTIQLNVPGKYDIYVKAIDKAGNETIYSKSGYKIVKNSSALSVPKTIYKNTKFNVIGTIFNIKEVESIEFWIQDYGDIEEGALLNSNDANRYGAKLHAPKDIPTGSHIVFMEIHYTDGTSERKSEQVTVVDFRKSDKSNSTRFINEDYLGTLDENSKWNNTEYMDALTNSLQNDNPDEETVIGEDKR